MSLPQQFGLSIGEIIYYWSSEHQNKFSHRKKELRGKVGGWGWGGGGGGGGGVVGR